MYFDNYEDDPTVASFKITGIEVITIGGLKYEYNINEEGYTEPTTNNTYSYTSTSLPNTNTITVRVTNSNGEQRIKTATYLKGIEIKALTNESTGAPVTVDVNWPSGSEKGTKQIKIGDNDWQTYTGEVTITEDCTVMARVIDGVEWVSSETASKEISVTLEISGIIITPGTEEQDEIATTEESITVDVNWPSGSEKGTKQIKIGDNDWKIYTGTETITESCRVMARVIDGEYKVESTTSNLLIQIAVPENLLSLATIQQAMVKATDTNGNTFVVPGGFTVRTDLATTVDEGIVIEDSDGNQFVWVPIGEVTRSDGEIVNIDFGRYSDFSLNATPAQYATNWNAEVIIDSSYTELTTYRESLFAGKMPNNSATAKDLATYILNAIANEGYYIARYEASFGSGDVISSGNTGTTSAGTKAITNQKPAFKQSTSALTGSNIATVTSTPGTLWNYIRQGDASLACQNMYAGNEYNGQNFVESDLVNSYAWDTALMFIQKCSSQTDYATQVDTLAGSMCNTGLTSDVVCNIYDMGGNLEEYTTETSSYYDTQYKYYYSAVKRGRTFAIKNDEPRKKK